MIACLAGLAEPLDEEVRAKVMKVVGEEPTRDDERTLAKVRSIVEEVAWGRNLCEGGLGLFEFF